MSKLKRDEYIGAVHADGIWRFFAGTLAEWILDYNTYDPNYDPNKWSGTFRNNLLRVEVNQASAFQDAMRAHELSEADIKALVKERGADKVPLTVVVDFDERQFVNSYYDLALEEYVPPGWTAVFDDPQKYIPTPVRALWLQ